MRDFHASAHSPTGTQSCCKSCKSRQCHDYYIRHSATVREKTLSYYNNNKAQRCQWEKIKCNDDTLFKLKKRLRHRLRCAFYRLRKHRSKGSAIKDLGCSVAELRDYLEKQFRPGMTWDNWSSSGWHIDHRIPLASASNEVELLKLCHFTNLQPMWARDNISKGGTI